MNSSPERFKKGDRVKITIEGDVEAVVDDQEVRLRGWLYYLSPASPGVVAIEKLPDPLPTTPGSVIRHIRYGYYRMLDEDGVWFGRPGHRMHAVAADLREQDYDIIYDAGKAS